jgi:hypothetical protein
VGNFLFIEVLKKLFIAAAAAAKTQIDLEEVFVWRKLGCQP